MFERQREQITSKLLFFNGQAVLQERFEGLILFFLLVTTGWTKTTKSYRFAFNNHVRDSIMLNASPEETVQLYEGNLTLDKMLRDQANQIKHKLVPGDVISFNNSRVLHGRSAFTETWQGSRFLSAIYLDWDMMYSRMRVLIEKINIPFNG